MEKELEKYGITIEQYGKILKEIDDIQYGISDKDWEDIVKEYNINISPVTLRKSSQTIFGGVKRSEYLNSKKANDGNDEYIVKLNETKRELEILKVQYQDERRVNSKYMRPLARHERMLGVIREEMQKLEPLPYEKAYVPMDYNKQASLLISDLHYGITCNNYWNKYNTSIAKDRMFKLVQDVVEYCDMLKVETLHIELLGDLISGIIHKTLELENEVDVIKQTLQCSELLSVCINELANKVSNIKVYMTVGNHSRVTANKKESVDSENFEYIIWDELKLRVQRDDVEFVENDIDETFIHYEIDGKSIFGVHGHLDKITKIASDFAKMFQKPIMAIHAGHLHHAYTDEDSNIQIVMNSTASGVDTHSKNLRYIGNPSQTLLVYDGENTINFNIKL